MNVPASVVDKNFFENRGNVIVNKMMDNPVAEIGGKNLAFYRFINDKANAWFGFIPVFKNFVAQGKYIGFEMLFKGQRVDGIAFVFPGIEIGLKQELHQLPLLPMLLNVPLLLRLPAGTAVKVTTRFVAPAFAARAIFYS